MPSGLSAQRTKRLAVHTHNTTQTTHTSYEYYLFAEACSFGAECFYLGCTKGHSVEMCPRPDSCQDFTCGLRHMKLRTRKCKNGPKCSRPGCHFLHPEGIDSHGSKKGPKPGVHDPARGAGPPVSSLDDIVVLSMTPWPPLNA
jgi:hypothetical protein